MERHKERFGWKCVLSPAEVEHSGYPNLLSEYFKDWRVQPDGSAVLRVYPWTPGRFRTMELFIEALGESGFTTTNIYKVGGMEVVEREW